ncbi:two-component system sensor histidine kinase YesM [Hydrogenispora ethanolica]|uniref:Two-component system sensor histidine kinase YesM n=1 Tax=Hydrogenispora ethanolica TaxID=1082276 RepID=A0A4R1R1S1_HYDET|nr:sensor histidine kinase [Hydrogenispora ethanolica]TCL59242.1 two-component system sensor histidine kinase YesM [Hydrogenispora ethanolica]
MAFNKLKGLSISWKFTLIYFVLLMVPTVFIGISEYQNMVQSAKQQSDRNSSERIFQLKQNILYTIKNAENIAEEIVFSSELQAFLDNDFSFSPAEIDNFIYNFQNKLINIKHLYPNKFYKIRVFTSNQSTEEAYDILYSLRRIAAKDYYRVLMNSSDKMIWGDMKKAEEFYDVNANINPKQNKSIVIPLYERITPVISNQLIGVLEIDILIEKMFGDLNDLRLGEQGFIYVLDRNGKTISPIRNSRLAEQIHLKMFPGANGVKEIRFNNQRHRVEYETIKETDYKILAVVPEKEILQEVIKQKNMLIYIILAGISAVFLVTFLTTNFLFARLKVLVKMMKRIQSGEFDVRVEERGNDEIGDLARSFNQMAEKLEEVMLNLIEQETAHRDAEIRALQSQINPHFLFNTLESLRMECELREEYDLADVLTSLGKLFRYNIKWTNRLVPFKQEIEHIRNYVTVMKVRHREKFQFHEDIPEALLDYLVIKMMLQPLVENCFYHAFKNLEGIWKITIHGRVAGENLWIEITDNGVGIEAERLERINRGLTSGNDSEIDKKTEGFIGLWNVDKRIKMQFGIEYGITLESAIDLGTKIVIKLPAAH